MNMPARCAFYDPGGMSDQFGMLAAELSRKKIKLLDAITFSRKKDPNFTYDGVMERLDKFNKQFKWDFNVCESNNTGVPVIQGLTRKYGMKIISILTTQTKTPEAKKNPSLMDISGS